MVRKTWDETQADVDKLARDLAMREATAQLDEESRRALAKLGESLNMPAYTLIRFLVMMGALYVRDLDNKTLGVVRAITDGEINLEGPQYDLPF